MRLYEVEIETMKGKQFEVIRAIDLLKVLSIFALGRIKKVDMDKRFIRRI